MAEDFDHSSSEDTDLGHVEFETDDAPERDCFWTLKTASQRQRVVWALLYVLLFLHFIDLILSGTSRFQDSRGAALVLFLFQLLFILPMHTFLIYVTVIKRWMIVP